MCPCPFHFKPVLALAVVVEEVFPARVVVVLEHTSPHAVGVVAEAATVGLVSVAPGRDEGARIVQFEPVLVRCGCTAHFVGNAAGHLCPAAQLQHAVRVEQVVEVEHQLEESLLAAVEQGCIAAVAGLVDALEEVVGIVCQGLARQVGEVVIIVVASEGSTQQFASRAGHILRIVEDTRAAPRRDAAHLKGRAGAEHTFHGALQAAGAVERRVAQEFPSILGVLIVRSVARHGIVGEPGLRIRLAVVPRQFEERVIDYGHLLNGFGCCTDTLHVAVLRLHIEVAIDDSVQATEETRAAAEVVKHTIDSVVSLVFAEVRVGIAEEVKDDEVALGHFVQHLVLVSAPLPILDDPFLINIRVGCLHGFIDSLIGTVHIDAAHVGSFVEGVHTVINGRTHDLLENLVVVGRHILESLGGRVKDVGTCEAAPTALIVGSDACLCCEVAGHHAAETRQHGVHAQFAHAAQNLACQLFLARVPPLGVRTAPTFEVVHAPPGLEAGTRHEGIGFRLAVVVLLRQQTLPHHVQTDNLQGHVDAVQGHPVDFLLPAFPRPGGHGVGEGAIVEVIAVVSVTGVRLVRCGNGQGDAAEVRREVIPCQIDVGIVIEIPVDTRGDGQRRTTLDAGFAVLCGNGKNVFAAAFERLVHDGHEAVCRATATDAVEQSRHGFGVRGRCHHGCCCQREQNSEKDTFYFLHDNNVLISKVGRDAPATGRAVVKGAAGITAAGSP